MDKWINFYKDFFPALTDAEMWVERCEALEPPNNRAKIMMHQAQRLISIADDIVMIRASGESLQLLFYMICAEHLAKLDAKFVGEGHSRKHVHLFFDNFVIGSDREVLGRAFTGPRMRYLTFRQAVDLLYDVRCDVVHEGNYWSFSFCEGSTPMLLNTGTKVITVNLTINDLRTLVIRGCINAVTHRLNVP